MSEEKRTTEPRLEPKEREELQSLIMDWWLTEFGKHDKNFGDIADAILAAGFTKSNMPTIRNDEKRG